jgi:hypothetical protein
MSVVDDQLRGDARLLAHCRLGAGGRAPADERLELRLGARLARLLLFALAGGQTGRRGSSSP